MTTEPEQKKPERQRRPTAAEERERARQAFQLRLSGAQFDAIARALNYFDASSAFHAYRGHLKRTSDPAKLEEWRELEIRRLEDKRMALYTQALGAPGRAPPDLDAMRLLLLIHDRTVRLLGLHREPTFDPTEELIAFAKEHDLDPDLVLREADGIIAASRHRWKTR